MDASAAGSAASSLARARCAARLLAAAALCFSLACATPVGVERADPRRVHRTLTSNILTTGELSNPTLNVLHRRGLTARFQAEPEAVLAELHAAVAAERGSRDDVFALAELSFQHASRTHQRRHFLASMVYAYAFLFPGSGRTPADPYDPRFRLACDLYNLAISEGFASADGKLVDLRGGSYALPFGDLQVSFDERELTWGSRRLVNLVPVADLEVHGMWARYRWAGIGAPLAAGTEPLDPERGFDDFVQPWVKVPITAVVRILEPRPGADARPGDGVARGRPRHQSDHHPDRRAPGAARDRSHRRARLHAGRVPHLAPGDPGLPGECRRDRRDHAAGGARAGCSAS